MADNYVNQIEFLDGEGEVTATHDIQDIDHADLARIDGAYEGMTVGNAEQLVSTVGITDSVPYNFRTSGGTADIGDREEDTVVGGTVSWNQLAVTTRTNNTDSGVTLTSDGDGVYTLTGTSTGNPVWRIISGNYTPIANHVYYHSLKSNGNNVYLFRNGYTASKANNMALLTKYSNTAVYSLMVSSGVTVNETVVPQIFDLTAMFGSTIADYIYSLEQANAGAGAAWFRKLFPKPYYEYNAGELLSVNTSAHNTVGFNAWDEEWEAGTYYLDTGLPQVSVTYFRTKNPIHVIPNTTYHVYCGTSYSVSALFIFRYDANDNYLGYNSYSTLTNYNITIPSDCHYIRFVDIRRNTYNPSIQPICINLSWDGERDGEYEPYVKHEYPLDSSLILRGIPKLDSANELYYDGDVYESDGTVTRKYGIVDLGTLTWARSTNYTNPFFYANISSTGNGNLICPIYVSVGAMSTSAFGIADNMSIGVATPNGSQLYIRNDSYTDAAAFKTAMSGAMLVYELKTPTTEEAEGFTNPQIVDDFGTEEYVDYAEAQGTRDVAIPVGHNTYYQANLRAKVEMMPDSPSGGDGVYCVKQTNGINEYVPLVIPQELPNAPSTDGSFSLVCTVTNGVATYSWVQN